MSYPAEPVEREGTPAARRVALVAGASGGIGGAVGRALARGGARVWLGYRVREERARAVAEAIRAGGGSAEVVRLDVCLETEAEAACQRIYDSDGRLDILVNAAGLSREAPALAMEDGEWALVLATNLTGAFRLARSAARYMVLGRWGRIIHISSIAASAGGRGQAGYAASKAGLEALSRVLALELGRKGVAVNAVAPGVIETAMSERVRREHGPALLEEIAVRRFGSPEDVAAAVAFLASDAAAYITGQVLRVDGGLRL